jgi:hypothetical protein
MATYEVGPDYGLWTFHGCQGLDLSQISGLKRQKIQERAIKV